jgi:hypothetical protein
MALLFLAIGSSALAGGTESARSQAIDAALALARSDFEKSASELGLLGSAALLEPALATKASRGARPAGRRAQAPEAAVTQKVVRASK